MGSAFCVNGAPASKVEQTGQSGRVYSPRTKISSSSGVHRSHTAERLFSSVGSSQSLNQSKPRGAASCGLDGQLDATWCIKFGHLTRNEVGLIVRIPDTREDTSIKWSRRWESHANRQTVVATILFFFCFMLVLIEPFHLRSVLSQRRDRLSLHMLIPLSLSDRNESGHSGVFCHKSTTSLLTCTPLCARNRGPATK
ncbi:hypothetical protein BR93DRAFT_651213 [Coniochaeta sp. PMI_546]|nr:hypothetical protein BR93DRAFT_651213 [Coniochaeta sp. PMI_546]